MTFCPPGNTEEFQDPTMAPLQDTIITNTDSIQMGELTTFPVDVDSHREKFAVDVCLTFQSPSSQRQTFLKVFEEFLHVSGADCLSNLSF